LFFICIELGPTIISDVGLITSVGFAANPKFYTNNSSIIQKLIYYWFPITILCANFTISQHNLQSSLQNREIRSHPLSTLQPPPLPAHGWSPRTCVGGSIGSPQMRQLREEGDHSGEGSLNSKEAPTSGEEGRHRRKRHHDQWCHV
jgi:hypothetical protein